MLATAVLISAEAPLAVDTARAQSFKIPSSLKKYLPFTKKKKRRRRHSRRGQELDVPLPVRKPGPGAWNGQNIKDARQEPDTAPDPEPESRPAKSVKKPDPVRQTLKDSAEAAELHMMEERVRRDLAAARSELKRLEKEGARAKPRKIASVPEQATEQVALPVQAPRNLRKSTAGKSQGSKPRRKAKSSGKGVKTVMLVEAAWTNEEIDTARTACRQILKNIKAVTIRVPPIREGACGTAAPIQIRSITSGPMVRIKPPATLNCQMLRALDRWLGLAQRTARRELGADIAAMQNVSGYTCRNRYNGANRKISQHAFANALDIASFTLSDGRRVTVKNGWGPTKRDIAAEKKAENSGARKATETPAPTTGGPKGVKPGTARDIEVLLKRSASKTGKALEKKNGPPKEEVFLKTLHRQACKHFATVLGPEANDAHRDHFHLDLAPRRRRNYCQ